MKYSGKLAGQAKTLEPEGQESLRHLRHEKTQESPARLREVVGIEKGTAAMSSIDETRRAERLRVSGQSRRLAG